MCMQGLLNNGDEVLVPMPDYPLWTASVSLAGGTPVHYICDEQAEWYPDIDDIKSKITSNTKAIVIINPNNPTGALYPKELLLEIVEVARQNDLIIYSDEIYDRLVMDGLVHVPIATLAPDLFVVTLNGLSKSHRVAGFRCGWMVLSGDKSRVKVYRRAKYACFHAVMLKCVVTTNHSNCIRWLSKCRWFTFARWQNTNNENLFTMR